MYLTVMCAALCLGGNPTRMEVKVDGVEREALVAVPDEIPAGGAPLVFAFHGHGGNMRNMARGTHLHELWPAAIVVYPQGLPTSTRRDPEGKRAGWQNTPGQQEDRDLKLFDALLETIRKKHRVDDTRIYATGHSNGGGFTYCLWSARGKVFAAVAPSSCGATKIGDYQPLPALHVAGRKDEVVPFDGQEQVMQAVRKLNGCEAEGREWAKDCLEYPSKTGTPFVAFIHPGGHQFPPETPELIVRFFKEHAKQPAAAASAEKASR